MTNPPDHLPKRAWSAVLFATSVPLFLGALLSDWAYSSTYVIQWTNFASWLNSGALVIVGAALLWSLVSLLRAGFALARARLIYFLLAPAVFVLGFINALVHAKDAWAAMPAALILSVIVFLLALAAAWFGLHGSNRRVSR